MSTADPRNPMRFEREVSAHGRLLKAWLDALESADLAHSRLEAFERMQRLRERIEQIRARAKARRAKRTR